MSLLVLTILAVFPARPDTWTRPFQLSDANGAAEALHMGFCYQHTIATDPSGNVHVVWYQYGGSGTRREVKYRRWSAASGSWEPELQLTAGGCDNLRPAVACDNSGNVHVVWYSSTGSNYGIYYRKWDSGSGSWGPITRIHDPGGDYLQYYPSIACRPGGDNVHVVWFGKTPTSDTLFRIWHKEYVPGSGWTQTTRVSLNDATTAEEASVAVDSGDSVYVTWKQPTSVGSKRKVMYRSRSGAGTWSPSAEQVSNVADSYDAWTPGVAVNSDGSIVYCVWAQMPSSGAAERIYCRTRTNGTWGQTATVSANPAFDQWHCAVAVGPDSVAHFTWRGHEDSLSGVKVHYRMLRSTVWSSVGLAAGWPGSRDSLWYPSVAAQGDSLVHIAWYNHLQSETENEAFYLKGTIPAPPLLIAPANHDTLGSRRPVFSWSGCGSRVTYRIQVDDDLGFVAPAFDTTAADSNWTPYADLPEGKLYWRVLADDAGCLSRWSEVWDFTTDYTAPDVPVLSDSFPPQDTIADNAPDFDWSFVSDARRYTIDTRLDTVPPEPYPLAIHQPEGEDSSCWSHPESLPLPDGVYRWKVNAVDSAGNASAYSASHWFAVDLTPPAVPELLYPVQGETVSTVLPVLDWEYVPDARRYNVEVYKRGNPVPVITRSIVQTVQPDDSSSYALQPGEELADLTDYFWRVEALDYARNSSGFSPADTFRVELPRHDVAATAILTPSGVVPESTTLFPRVRVKNDGQATEDFNVRLVIEGTSYDHRAAVTALEPGEEVEVLFSESWTATPSRAFHVRCSTELAGDCDETDNKVEQDFEVRPAVVCGWTEMRPLPGNVPVKDGGWIVTARGQGIKGSRDQGTVHSIPRILESSNPVLYVCRGNKTSDFLCYDPAADSWQTLAAIPADEGGRNRPPGKGCAATTDGEQRIYVTKGNNTSGFWQYDITGDTWTRLPDVPAGPAGLKVKGGAALAYVVDAADTGWVYLLKGCRTEFYRYNVLSRRWETLGNAPHGGHAKYGPGSFLVYDGQQRLYCHQARYHDGTRHYLFKYDVPSRYWFQTPLAGMPLAGMTPGGTRNKRSKNGGSGTWFSDRLYALKGGNTGQFYSYEPVAGAWAELDTMPATGASGRRKLVRQGGSIATFGNGTFYALKGNKTNELWRYVTPSRAQAQAQAQARSGVMAGLSTIYDLRLTISPNPLAAGFAAVRVQGSPGPVASLRIFDITGRCVLHHPITSSLHYSIPLDLRALPRGVYLVRLDAGGHRFTQKLVVER